MRKTYDRELKLKISQDLLEKKVTTKRIAEEYNISRPTISRWVSEYHRYEKNAFAGQGKRLPDKSDFYIGSYTRNTDKLFDIIYQRSFLLYKKRQLVRYSKEFKESMISLHQIGRSASSLSKEYNVSVSTLEKWIRQADPFDQNVLSIKERELLKENKRLKEEIDILKHRITRILTVLKIPRTTYYDYLNWTPSDLMIRRQQLKEKVLKSWLAYPM